MSRLEGNAMRDVDDSEVQQAEAARDQARARYDQADEAWKTLAYERLQADVCGKLMHDAHNGITDDIGLRL